MKLSIHRKISIRLIFLVISFLASDMVTAVEQNYRGQESTNTLQASRRRSQSGFSSSGMYKSQVLANWFAENTRFWYRNDLRDNKKEFILVDAEKGTRERAFDHDKLAQSLSKVTQQQYSSDQLPFSTIEFVDDGKAMLFNVTETTYKCDLNSYEISKSDTPMSIPEQPQRGFGGQRGFRGDQQGMRGQRGQRGQRELRGQGQGQRSGQFQFNRGQFRGRGGGARSTSPDEKWVAFVRDNNVYMQEGENGQEIQLSTDGAEDNSYQRLQWAPDSQSFIAWRVEPGDNKEVYLIQSSPPEGGRAVLNSHPYALPGDKFDAYELNIFNVAQRKQIKPDIDRVDLGSPRPRWNSDSYHFAYEKVDRGHQRFRVIEVDIRDGSSRNIIDEKTDTFIWTAHTENIGVSTVTYLDETDEIIYASEMDGWRHLYLIDTKTGKIKNKITDGEWLVRGVQNIDTENRQVWFSAGSYYPDQDPYFVHYFRVNFDGTDLVALTEGNGTHSISYSPDRKYIIDSYSRVDMAPQTELRRVSDGKLICELEKADITELIEGGWEAPEVFVTKGRDGKTDIWGIICRPSNLDPTKKYPILEDIYAGPQSSFTPKSFSARNRYSAYNDLGFIVVKLDGMGTANRSKAFHDVCWHNLKDGDFLDRILWIKAAAAKYPYMDIERVGVYGTSAGGQNAAGAVLFHPEFYKAAVANSGCHDNRMDKSSWNEQWMGYPVGPQYSECSNIDNAWRLQGRLFLIVGEMDTNVPPESTMRFVDALIKANKDFDMLVVPGANHGAGSPITTRKTQDFFVRYLLGKEIPNRNAQPEGQTAP